MKKPPGHSRPHARPRRTQATEKARPADTAARQVRAKLSGLGRGSAESSVRIPSDLLWFLPGLADRSRH